MKYANPIIPEGINVSGENPLKELALLGGGVLLAIGAVVFALSLIAGSFARLIPFEFELELVQDFPAPETKSAAVEKYLQTLADRLAAAQGLDDDMPVTVHYMDDATINAFATFGGRMFLHRGLLERIPNENSLAMVISHEIAHIKHRHPIMSLGRGVVVGLALAAIFNVSGNDLAVKVLGEAGFLTALSFSREQEQQADETALATLEQIYGHVSGAEELFRIFLDLEKGSLVRVPQFFNTHPDTTRRIQNIRAIVREAGWAADRPVTPLPLFYRKEIKG